MADTGWLSPSSVRTFGSGANAAWTNPSDIFSSNDTYATAAIAGAGLSQVIMPYIFGASIPVGSIINGIEFRIECKSTIASTSTDLSGFIVIDANTSTGSAGSFNNFRIYPELAEGYFTFGNSSGGIASYWGQYDTGAGLRDWTSADIAGNSNVGLYVEGRNVDGSTQTISIDTIQMRIWYTPASSSGPSNPTNSVSNGGTVSWASPNNANASDNVYTTHTVSTTAANMPYLNTSGYGFNIPYGATITGINVVVEKLRNGGTTGNVRDNTVQLMKAGTRVGTNKAVTATNWATTDTNSSYGGGGDLWGTTWTPAEINASDFGVSVRTVGNGAGANRVANVDNIRVTVSYIPPIYFVQKSAQLFADNQSTISPSLSGVTAGNFVAMLVSCSNAGGATTALAAPSGWSTAVAPAGPSGTSYVPVSAIFYKLNSAGGTESGTVSIEPGSYAMATIAEFSGVQTSSALDVQTFATGTSSTAGSTGTTATTSVANSLVLAIGHPEDGIGATASLSSPATTGYTALETNPDNSVHIAADFGYKLLTSTGTESAAWTWTTSSSYTNVIAAFKGPAAFPVDGSISTTLGAATASVTGNVRVSGAVSATLGAATASLTGTVGTGSVTGSINTTLGAATSSLAGSVRVSGDIDRTLGAATVSLTGNVGSSQPVVGGGGGGGLYPRPGHEALRGTQSTPEPKDDELVIEPVPAPPVITVEADPSLVEDLIKRLTPEVVAQPNIDLSMIREAMAAMQLEREQAEEEAAAMLLMQVAVRRKRSFLAR